jgi:glucuronate isomerase
MGDLTATQDPCMPRSRASSSTIADPIQKHVFSRLSSSHSDHARALYERISPLPFIDVHTHYSELEVFTNRRYATPTEFLLGTYGAHEGAWNSPFDHYLANLLRRQGASESTLYGQRTATGASDANFDELRFDAIIRALSRERLHPVRIWVEITLRQILGIDTPLTTDSASMLWREISTKLQEPRFHARELLIAGNVVAACTTDAPTADLSIHREHNTSQALPLLLPTFRPDGALLSPRATVRSFVDGLEKILGRSISTTADLLTALHARMEVFAANSCRSMDIGFDNFYASEVAPTERETIFSLLLGEKPLSPLQSAQWKSFMLRELCVMASTFGWTIYLHQGPARDTNSRIRERYGFDAGGDAQGCRLDNVAFQRFLDHLTQHGRAPKVIVFPINSSDWEPALISMAPFQHAGAGIPCPLQLGPPWWFNDTIEGMSNWLTLITQHANYRDTIGMISDSRVLHTVLSRNQLFRAVLAGWLVEHSAGASDEMLYDEALDICGGNARRTLGLSE